jgi:hypothetical protein
MTSTSSAMINIGCHISFRWANNFWLHLHKESLPRTHRKLHPLCYGSYTITKTMGDNSFELNIPPFLGLHPVFNVDLLHSYFPPLLDTSEVAEQLTPIELNPTGIQKASRDQIVDTHIKGNRQQRIHTLLSRQSRKTPAPRQVAHQGPNSAEISSSDGGTQHNGDYSFVMRED